MDLSWFERHLTGEILPRWLRHAVRSDTGLFIPHLNRDWSWNGKAFGTLVSQCRLLYDFSMGFRRTGDHAYRDAVIAGADFLISTFKDREHGGWFWSCGMDGGVLDSRKDCYGHAFVIFGLAHACGATGDRRYLDEAIGTYGILERRFKDNTGGYAPSFSRDFIAKDGPKSQNPLMHLFEALLALGDQDPANGAYAWADRVGRFVLERLRRPDGVLPEMYDSEWREPAASSGGRVDIGHAFEWAFLCMAGAERGLDGGVYKSAARQFMDYGMQTGYDTELGGIFSPASPDMKITSRKKGWWEQCEAIRALLRFHFTEPGAPFKAELEQSVGFIRSYLVDPEFGGWYTGVNEDLSPQSTSKGSEWKMDYHVVGMCEEALRYK